MKKLILTLLILLSVTSCMRDDILEPMNIVDVPKGLVITEVQGLKLESTIVSEEVSMNVKLEYAGTYRIKIRDISGELISQEKINGEQGDNILKVYVSTLPKSSYTILLTDYDHNVIGITTIVVE